MREFFEALNINLEKIYIFIQVMLISLFVFEFMLNMNYLKPYYS